MSTQPYVELFGLRSEGTREEIEQTLSGVVGVKSWSLPKRSHLDGKYKIEVKYSPHTTDRTRIAEEIETCPGVEYVEFG